LLAKKKSLVQNVLGGLMIGIFLIRKNVAGQHKKTVNDMENTQDIQALLDRIGALEGKVEALEAMLNHDHQDLVMLRKVAIDDHEDLEKLKQAKLTSPYSAPARASVPSPTYAAPVGL
jgi:DNA-binding FrmR family transcriptional regulator